MFDIFRDTSPIVEPMSIDEAFIDVAGLWRIAGTPADIATELRRRVADEAGLPISVGVARTKFLAKVASAVSKPDGLLVVEPEGELDFLHPLPGATPVGSRCSHADEARRPRAFTPSPTLLRCRPRHSWRSSGGRWDTNCTPCRTIAMPDG